MPSAGRAESTADRSARLDRVALRCSKSSKRGIRSSASASWQSRPVLMKKPGCIVDFSGLRDALLQTLVRALDLERSVIKALAAP